MHRPRGRCIADADVQQIGPHIKPHRRCIGESARSSDPAYFDPHLGGPEVQVALPPLTSWP
eukprot:423845-Pyramimonas_sp.AAC.1